MRKGYISRATRCSISNSQKSRNRLNWFRVYGKNCEESEASSRRSEKNADDITNAVSAQAMQRSPDINAANAFSRVSAVTIQHNSGSDDAYAIIRGLETCYNNTLINGVKVPARTGIALHFIEHVPSGFAYRSSIGASIRLGYKKRKRKNLSIISVGAFGGVIESTAS